MRYIDILEGFELEINQLDDVVNKPLTNDSLYWLNQAVIKFVKLRYNRDFVHGTGYEMNEKRYKDLINLIKREEVDCSNMIPTQNATFDKIDIEYPKDFMFTLNEDVLITDTSGGHEYDTNVFECTADTFMYRITNALTDFHYSYHKARPIRIRTLNGCSLLTDKNYKIQKYVIGYLRVPKKITLDNPYDEYNEFEDIIIPEIIKIAAQMYLENKSNERYKTISGEVLTQE